jgi:hypothetical protein
MTGTPGIPPVWDIDGGHRDRPRWYAMPHERPLAGVFDGSSALLDVVVRVTEPAETWPPSPDRAPATVTSSRTTSSGTTAN